MLNAKYCKTFRPKLSEQTRQRSKERQPIIDRPTLLLYIWISKKYSRARTAPQKFEVDDDLGDEVEVNGNNVGDEGFLYTVATRVDNINNT